MKALNIGALRAYQRKVCKELLQAAHNAIRSGDVSKAQECLADWRWAFDYYKSLFV